MKTSHKPLIAVVFLVFVGLVSQKLIVSQPNTLVVKSLLGGESSAERYSSAIIGVAQAQIGADGDLAALAPDGSATVGASSQSVVVGGDSYFVGSVQDPGQPIGADVSAQQSVQYTVKQGDTVSSVAAQFGVTAASIVSANANIRKNTLKIGSTITIPEASETTSVPAVSLPNFNADFIMPAKGYNEGVLAADNSVEIENSCGTPVTAAADGVVVADTNISDPAGGWNDGYGTFVLLEHSFGNEIFTRYAHLQESMVPIGDYVKQGQEIGLMGQTGGASTCGLDFEVMGAQNPF